MVSLGGLYETGNGLPQDYGEAMKWYRKVVDADRFGVSFDAMERIGNLYENGLGVPKDHAQAVAWYEKSAANGSLIAKDWLAKNR